MEDNRLEQLAALDVFVRSFFSPATEHWNANKDASEVVRAMAGAILIEAFLWLELGARLRIYNAQQAKDLIYTRREFLYKQEHLLSGTWRFFFDQDFITQLFTSVRRGITEGETYPKTEEFEFGMAFQLFMQQAAGFALNPLTREVSSALNFYRLNAFESLIVADIVAGDVIDALSDPASSRIPLKAQIVAGYFLTLQHMDAAVLMFGNHQRPKSIDPGQWAVFRMAVFQIAHWRLSFRGHNQEQVRVRFEKLTQNLEAALQSGAGEYNIKLQSGGLKVATDGLVKAWEDLALPAVISADGQGPTA